MRCVNCGVEMIAGAAFCPSCGQPASLTLSRPAGNMETAKPALQSNVASALCYLAGLVTGILFLAIEPYRRDRVVRFHAFQSIFLNVTWFAVYFALSLFLVIFPGLLLPLVSLLHWLLDLGVFLLWLLLMYKAYHREQLRLPLIGDLSLRQI
jgi:uncharacterized membrane protein